MLKLILISSFLFLPFLIMAQVSPVKTPKEIYIDSIKRSQYRYVFPAWGKRIVKKGIELPLPVGIMVNYINGSQDVTISDLQVGFNGNPMVPLDFIEFGKVSAKFQSINARIDLWPLPFFNIYGVVGKSFAKTEISVSSPFEFSSTANFEGPTAGFGATVGGKLHRLFFAADYNNSWTFFSQIEGAIRTQGISFRAGLPIPFKQHPKKNLLIWVGASGLFVNRTTMGEIFLSDLMTDQSRMRLDEIKQETADWYQNLKPAQKNVVKSIAEKISEKMDGNDVSDSTISYSLNKRAVSNWSMLAGAQFQFDPNWQLRTETGFLGGRSSLLISFNYRFGL